MSVARQRAVSPCRARRRGLSSESPSAVRPIVARRANLPSTAPGPAPTREAADGCALVCAFAEYAERERLPCKTIIRDHEAKYTSEFDRAFTRRGIDVTPVGPRAPNLNAFVEPWIQSLRHEALDHFIVFGLAHFDHIVAEFVTYYHDCRPHQGIGNRLINRPNDDCKLPIENVKQLRCELRLGGLLKTYRRAA